MDTVKAKKEGSGKVVKEEFGYLPKENLQHEMFNGQGSQV
jgi:hypothetical protein